MSDRNAHTDIATAWGLAAGTMVHLSEEVYLHLRYAYAWGGDATQPDLETVHMDAQRNLRFQTRTADTRAWRFEVGLVGYF